jgi:hypothetical protein
MGVPRTVAPRFASGASYMTATMAAIVLESQMPLPLRSLRTPANLFLTTFFKSQNHFE